jgi:8-oxo-dGTP pyrophosphatase MutT (NUDIX family)
MTWLDRKGYRSSNGSNIREGTAAILVGTDGRLLLQLRDNLPGISDAGKIGLFGGRREGGESFLQCVVREVYEEIGYYLPPERFEKIGTYHGPDHFVPDGRLSGEIFLARDVPADELSVTEGALRIVAIDELHGIRGWLALPAKFALGIFLRCDFSG